MEADADEIGYSKIKLLGLFSLFDINRYDTAVILAALEKVDESFSQTIDVELFASKYVKEWGWVFVLLWENYFELLNDLKESLEVDNKDSNGDATEQSELEEEEKKDEQETANTEMRKKLIEYRRRPEYFVFLGFLFFIFVKKDLNCFALSLTLCLNDLKFTCIGI